MSWHGHVTKALRPAVPAVRRGAVAACPRQCTNSESLLSWASSTHWRSVVGLASPDCERGPCLLGMRQSVQLEYVPQNNAGKGG